MSVALDCARLSQVGSSPAQHLGGDRGFVLVRVCLATLRCQELPADAGAPCPPSSAQVSWDRCVWLVLDLELFAAGTGFSAERNEELWARWLAAVHWSRIWGWYTRKISLRLRELPRL